MEIDSDYFWFKNPMIIGIIGESKRGQSLIWQLIKQTANLWGEISTS